MSLIDTYSLSTLGVNSNSTHTIVSNGILLKIEISTPIPAPFLGSNYSGGKDKWEKKEKEKRKITITALIGGKEYIKTLIIQGKPNLSVNDFNIEISLDNPNPKITVNFKK